nr:hypothetical protein Iba_chr03aCG21300 [Ipomoea batatas]
MAPPVAPPSKPAFKKVRDDRCEKDRMQSDQNCDMENDRILMSDQENLLASKNSEETKEVGEGKCANANPAGKKEVKFDVAADENLEKRNVLKPPMERDFVVTNTGNVATVSGIKSEEKLMEKTTEKEQCTEGVCGNVADRKPNFETRRSMQNVEGKGETLGGLDEEGRANRANLDPGDSEKSEGDDDDPDYSGNEGDISEGSEESDDRVKEADAVMEPIEENPPPAGQHESEREREQNVSKCTPYACENDCVRDNELTAVMNNENMEAGSTLVKQGLEELACKGISVDQFVGDAVLEAAISIIEEAAGNVMAEEVAGNDGKGSQNAHEENSSAGGLEADLATPSPTLGGVKEIGGGTRLKDMNTDISKESNQRCSSASLSFSTWAKGMKEKWGPEHGNLIDEAKQEVLHFFEKALKDLGQAKYDEMEPQLLEEACSMFERKLKEVESKERVDQEVKGKVGNDKKKEWELLEWALLLKEKWNQDEDLGDIIESSLEEIRAYLRNNHGGWLEKFDAKAASEASSILKCKIEASSIGKKYGPKSRLGWGLKCKHLSTGYFLCDWARKYFSDVIEEDSSEGSGGSEESDED